MNNGNTSIDQTITKTRGDKELITELREIVLDHLEQKEKYYDDIEINCNDSYYSVAIFKERFDGEMLSEHSVFTREVLESKRSKDFVIKNNVVESSISESIYKIRCNLEQRLEINDSRYTVNMTCGLAQCRDCNATVIADMNNIMSFPKEYTEMSHISTQPSSWENLLDIIDERVYPTLKFYLIGRVQEKCNHN